MRNKDPLPFFFSHRRALNHQFVSFPCERDTAVNPLLLPARGNILPSFERYEDAELLSKVRLASYEYT